MGSQQGMHLICWSAGPKPVACEKPMCRYQVDELGFGASVVVIYQEPMVADMLISLAAKAAGNPNPKHRQRFFACPYPPSDFVCSSKRTANAANPDESMGIKWAELQQVIHEVRLCNWLHWPWCRNIGCMGLTTCVSKVHC